MAHSIHTDSSIRAFKRQSYSKLKAQHSRNRLFEDPEFPAHDSSLFKFQPQFGCIEWKRPREVRADAAFTVDGFHRCDMDQGIVGNCWFIAAVAGIATNQRLFAKVVPQNQNLSGSDYAGIFHFRFWLYGEWVDVVIDDRLPFWPDGKLVFCSNKQEPNEFWGPLLEKAYAKVYGNYENLNMGQTYDALIDMSGGIQEDFNMRKLDRSGLDNLWTILQLSFEQESLLSCGIYPDPNKVEAQLPNGLVKGHAYTMTKVHLLDIQGQKVKLVRLRNPWGDHHEWKGRWSDSSSEWDWVREHEKHAIELRKDDDGEFWMEYNEFTQNFDDIQVCHLTANSYSDELMDNRQVSQHEWKCEIFHSKWATGYSAGGPGHTDPNKFWTNPQFLVKLANPGSDDQCRVLISMMQKDTRLKRIETGVLQAEEFVQFRLFRVHDYVDVDQNRNMKLYASQLDRIGSSGAFTNKREITNRFKVSPGNYLIIPCTYYEDMDCEFMIRVFSELPVGTNLYPLDDKKEDLDERDVYIETHEEDTFKLNIFLFDLEEEDDDLAPKRSNFDLSRVNQKKNYDDLRFML